MKRTNVLLAVPTILICGCMKIKPEPEYEEVQADFIIWWDGEQPVCERDMTPIEVKRRPKVQE